MDASGWKSPAQTDGRTRASSTSAADTPTKQENRPAFYGSYRGRALSGRSLPLKFQAIDDAVFNRIAQGVFRVIGGVRSNEHIWRFLQLQQQCAFNGFV